ncbi:MAG: FMN-binding protein [Microbacterium sp.]|uniref:FMN-binding protein n=1 Tax=Microbacterium sp. TaxID=51671 RepID=UPI001AD25946|nr:FMN-binding protein [Microbacterium sp.]MBN9175875.1 FMN-binding protein [Microbacterium sp.]
MIRTTAVARPIRVGVAAASVLGVVTLAGCAGAADAETPTPTPTATPTTSATPSASVSASPSAAASDSVYVDGTYSADGSYQTPESVETISVTVTLQDDVITSVNVTGNPQKRESEQYQGEFIGGISAEVVGKNIDEISVSRVAGSSLTSGGFNQAIETIKAEAAS